MSTKSSSPRVSLHPPLPAPVAALKVKAIFVPALSDDGICLFGSTFDDNVLASLASRGALGGRGVDGRRRGFDARVGMEEDVAAI